MTRPANDNGGRRDRVRPNRGAATAALAGRLGLQGFPKPTPDAATPDAPATGKPFATGKAAAALRLAMATGARLNTRAELAPAAPPRAAQMTGMPPTGVTTRPAARPPVLAARRSPAVSIPAPRATGAPTRLALFTLPATGGPEALRELESALGVPVSAVRYSGQTAAGLPVQAYTVALADVSRVTAAAGAVARFGIALRVVDGMSHTGFARSDGAGGLAPPINAAAVVALGRLASAR